MQNETLGPRGHWNDPLHRSRRRCARADERLDDTDAKVTVHGIYNIADEYVVGLGHDLQDIDCPPEVRQLGRTIVRWADQISVWRRSRVSNGPTEAIKAKSTPLKRQAPLC